MSKDSEIQWKRHAAGKCRLHQCFICVNFLYNRHVIRVREPKTPRRKI